MIITLPQEKQLDTGIYFNDMKDDPLDLQINCFDEFNKGIVNVIINFIFTIFVIFFYNLCLLYTFLY